MIVVGPHADGERRFERALTEDRELVMRAGRALMLRVAAEPGARADDPDGPRLIRR